MSIGDATVSDVSTGQRAADWIEIRLQHGIGGGRRAPCRPADGQIGDAALIARRPAKRLPTVAVRYDDVLPVHFVGGRIS
ncbi:unnamed protein product [Heligmosomoides polygyrus]|uniref:MOSC domain-containing protein n=1 Tax=Heligmosomoides polygyrus TaxID=6339 RepID=A0A183F3Q5_HELPZ|nr:unnamed protein product [Heligmosomoides polygyrus]